MSKPISNFKLGIFTIGGLAILVTGLLAFGLRAYFRPVNSYETYFPGNVNGLSVGSPVQLRGVQVGKVTGISFSWTQYQVSSPSYIVVQFSMRNDIEPSSESGSTNDLLQDAIKLGLRARIRAQGITGASLLSIEYMDPSENPPVKVPWTPEYTYIPSAPGQLVEIFGSLEKVLHSLQSLDFNGLNEHLQHDLTSAGSLLDRAGQIDFGSLSTNVNSLLADIRDSNARLKGLLQDTDDTVKKAGLEKLTRNLDALANRLQDTVTRLEPGLVNVDFESLNQTLNSARQAIRDLDDTLAELKQYPSGFLLGKPPTHVKGVESPQTP